MRRHILALSFVLATAFPAQAHRLKVFATVEDGAVSGYGFFIGGGRPEGSTVIIRDAAGKEVYRGATDSEGRFSWRPEKPSTLTIIVDTREGHVAETRISEDRFAGAIPTGAAPAGNIPAARDATSPAAGVNTEGCATNTGAAIASLVDQAVARQVRPLMESLETAEGRIRFNDVAGGVGMIFGLAGIALWAASRRREKSLPPPSET